MKITKETIDYVAALSKLQLTEEEGVKVMNDMEKILSYMETMDRLDTEQVAPMSHVFETTNVFREDTVVNTNQREILLSNTKSKKDGCFMVPKTVD